MNGKTLTAEQCSKLSLSKNTSGFGGVTLKVYASISGGKDSLAALITHMERGGQCDGAIYCRIMFDDETSAEVPEHEEWLHSKCFPLLEREYGIKTQIVQGKYTYTDCFYKQYEKGGKVGKIWGFPFLRGAWCNTRLKVRPIQAHIKTLGEFTEIVGIAADETKRIERKTVAGKILKQVVYKVTGGYTYELVYTASGRKVRTQLGADCTPAEKVEIEYLFDFYKRLWEKEKDAFLAAYIQKHRIFAIRADIEPQEMSLEESIKMSALMRGMSDESPLRAIEAGK